MFKKIGDFCSKNSEFIGSLVACSSLAAGCWIMGYICGKEEGRDEYRKELYEHAQTVVDAINREEIKFQNPST